VQFNFQFANLFEKSFLYPFEENKYMRNFFVILGIAILIFSSIAFSEEILVKAGHIFKVGITTEVGTDRWSGIFGNIIEGEVEDSNEAIFQKDIYEPNQIYYLEFSASNFLDDLHYIAFLPANTSFNLTKLYNVTEEDLEEQGIFNSTNFPIFHPNYYEIADNPKNTFCCRKKRLTIGGSEFEAFEAVLQKNVSYYLLKYKINETSYIPMFFVHLKSYTCFNEQECNFEAILPVGKTYYIYLLSVYPPIKIDVWIDEEQKTTFEQTALPYNVTVRTTYLYTGEPVSTNVIIFEENGNNIFFPFDAQGILSRGAALATTDENGYAKFVIAPTEYPTSQKYRIGVALSDDGIIITKRVNLTVINSFKIEFRSKQVAEGSLLDNIKTTINAMNPIINAMYKWGNEYRRGFLYYVIFYTNGSYRIINLSNMQQIYTIYLKTGAPNAITISLRHPNESLAQNYSIRARELRGYLLFNPTINPPTISSVERINNVLRIGNEQQFIITPTSYGDVNSTIYFEIIDPYNVKIGEIRNVTINSMLDFVGGSYFDPPDIYKTIVNAMNSVGYSLYYSSNY